MRKTSSDRIDLESGFSKCRNDFRHDRCHGIAPVFFAAMTSSNFFTTSSRYVAISVIMLAVLTMVGSSIFTAVLCSSANLRDLGSCTTSRSIKFVILFFEYLATVFARVSSWASPLLLGQIHSRLVTCKIKVTNLLPLGTVHQACRC